MFPRDPTAGLVKGEHGIIEVRHASDEELNGEESARLAVEIDSFRVLGLDDDDAGFYASFSDEQKKRVVRKVDLRLVPLLTILYLISHIDRGNIGNAKIEGLIEDLHMTGVQYNVALAVFFIPYLICAIPSNMLLKKVRRPSLYIGSLIVLWGITMTCMGLVQNFAGLVAVRFLLGLFEAGFFPGAVYLVSCWYMPDGVATRVSIFYCASSLSGAFSGLLAAAISKMSGLGGYAGWRWIFLIEGLATVVLGVLCLIVLIDTPALSRSWLSDEEIRFLELQTVIKQGGNSRSGGRAMRKELKYILKDWRRFALASFVFINASTSYGTKVTLPTITKSMGFSNTKAQLMSAPPYAAGAITTILAGYFSDRLNWRMPFIAVPCAFLLVGYSVIVSLKGDLASHIATSYVGIVIAVMGIYAIQPPTQAWNANNLAPAGRRSVGVGFMSTVGNFGSILGSFMYLETEAPRYPTGFGLSLALGAAGLVLPLVLEWSYMRANARKASMTESEVKARYSEEELFDLGDESPLFRHVL